MTLYDCPKPFYLLPTSFRQDRKSMRVKIFDAQMNNVSHLIASILNYPCNEKNGIKIPYVSRNYADKLFTELNTVLFTQDLSQLNCPYKEIGGMR